ncbi:MAG: ABC transporter permease [Planctomycetes bacterium]|nr:ABC transporter permease [Planctomycetota bacterium]NUQ33384.1 ABC transporter permease [Planctomycetaceae bacterium]
MWTFITRRLLYMIPILFGVLLLTYVIFFTVNDPQSVARTKLGGVKASEAQVTEWLVVNGYAEYGPSGKKKKELAISGHGEPDEIMVKLTDIEMHSDVVLFWNYVKGLFTFNFGKDNEGREVSEILKEGVIPSLRLVLPGFIIAQLAAIFFALFAALYRNTKIDRTLLIASVLMMSISPVAIILFLQKFLANEWHYFPVCGYDDDLLNGIRFLALPTLIYVVVSLGSEIRFNRIVILDEIGQDYVRTARAKGVSQNSMLFKHVFRNSLIPFITHWVVALPFLYLGSLLLERFFAIPGLGDLTIRAVGNSDVNVIRALVFIGTVLYMFGTLMGDVLYALADPRIKLR